MPRKTLPTLEYEYAFWRDGFVCVAGLDEAGRGALAGPVVAAAVILPVTVKDADWRKNTLLRAIARANDSKQLSERVREELYKPLCATARAYAIGFASHDEIDAMNILRASHLAMERALEQLSPPPMRCCSTRWCSAIPNSHNKVSYTATRARSRLRRLPFSPKSRAIVSCARSTRNFPSTVSRSTKGTARARISPR